MIKIKYVLFIGIGISLLALTGCQVMKHKRGDAPPVASESVQDKSPSGQTQEAAVIETNKGTIVFKFYPDDAPKTVENFKKLARQKFYDNLTWHRVEKHFVIQGGDPNGNGSGGPGYTIPAEFNARSHLEGTVAMARSFLPDSAGSQFYICLEARPDLDGKYTVFGQAIEGFDVIHKIEVGDRMLSVRIEDREVSS